MLPSQPGICLIWDQQLSAGKALLHVTHSDPQSINMKAFLLKQTKKPVERFRHDLSESCRATQVRDIEHTRPYNVRIICVEPEEIGTS